MLGTGNAITTECYNTCFIIEDEGRRLLVDGGGGNGLLHQLKRVHVDWRDLREIFRPTDIWTTSWASCGWSV